MPNTMTETVGPWDYDAGWALGGTLGIETPIDGVSLEIDVLRTVAVYSGSTDEVNSTSFMANAVYSVDLTDMFSLYGGAGLGIISLDYTPEGDGASSGSGAGYQVFAGVQAAIAENVALTLETRYQSSVDDIEMERADPYEQQFNRTSILAGVLFWF